MKREEAILAVDGFWLIPCFFEAKLLNWLLTEFLRLVLRSSVAF